MNDIFSEINGKDIIVQAFGIEHYDGTLIAKMKCVVEDEKLYLIVFQNVSKIRMTGILYPFQICGFEIVDYSSRGYQSDCRFFVNDYEDGAISFYCESFEIYYEHRN